MMNRKNTDLQVNTLYDLEENSSEVRAGMNILCSLPAMPWNKCTASIDNEVGLL